MNRRDFVGRGLLGLASIGLADNIALGDIETRPGAAKLKVPFVRDSHPEFQIPPYRGEWYEDTVPDTLDLTERLRLAVHASTSIADPEVEGEVFWLADFLRNPPTMLHDFNDWILQVEGLLEGVPLGRLACGSSENEDVDHSWMANWVLKSLGPDGLVYVPLGGRPWAHSGVGMPNQKAFLPDGTGVPVADPSVTQIGSGYTCNRVIPAMIIYYLRDQNPMWKTATEKMIQRLSQLVIHREDYAYYPDGVLQPNGSYGSHTEMPTGIWCIEWGGNGRLIQALAQYYAKTGYEPSIQLAAKIAKYVRLHGQYYTPEGAWLISDLEKSQLEKKFDVKDLRQGGHGHAHGIGLLSMLEYGLAANDRETIDFVRGGFDWASANGTPLLGFFPEWFVPGYQTCETDTVADMLGLAVKMSAAGVADYWDDVDRWTRNQFIAQQLTSTEGVYRIAERSPRKPVRFNEIGEKVPERSIGAFSGWAAPNDWVYSYKGIGASIQHCCTGNSTRTLYYIWEHILEYKDDQLKINLLLNRASPWADVYSHIPYQGKVEVKVKKPCGDLSLRVPEWIESGTSQVTAKRGASSVPLIWEGRYVRTGPANPGDTVVLTFPMVSRTLTENIANTTYTLEIRGNTVVSMTPVGENISLYSRDYMKADRAPTIKVKRFVAEQSLLW